MATVLGAMVLLPALPYDDAEAQGTPQQETKARPFSNNLDRELFSRLEKLWDSEKSHSLVPSPGERSDIAMDDGSASPSPGDDSGAGRQDSSEMPASENTAPENGVEAVAQDQNVLKLTNVGVFPDEEFELCGYKKFSARLVGASPEYNEIVVKSRDRTIPDIPFRGFEKKFPLESKADFWDGCSVIAGYVSVAGVVRIGLSVREDRKSE